MPKPSDREARLAEALRANLKRRKVGAKAPPAQSAAGVQVREPAANKNPPPANEKSEVPDPRPNPAPKCT